MTRKNDPTIWFKSVLQKIGMFTYCRTNNIIIMRGDVDEIY